VGWQLANACEQKLHNYI
jgi:pyruvate dehydrogenase phosphatase